MPNRTIHDNRVLGYEVDAEARRITFRTRSETGNPPELTTVIFEQVEAYLLEGDNMQTILRGIAEIPIAEFLEENRSILESGAKFNWPGSWNTSQEAIARRLEARQVRPFEVASSYGMGGWIVCREVRIEPSALYAA